MDAADHDAAAPVLMRDIDGQRSIILLQQGRQSHAQSRNSYQSLATDGSSSLVCPASLVSVDSEPAMVETYVYLDLPPTEDGDVNALLQAELSTGDNSTANITLVSAAERRAALSAAVRRRILRVFAANVTSNTSSALSTFMDVVLNCSNGSVPVLATSSIAVVPGAVAIIAPPDGVSAPTDIAVPWVWIGPLILVIAILLLACLCLCKCRAACMYYCCPCCLRVAVAEQHVYGIAEIVRAEEEKEESTGKVASMSAFKRPFLMVDTSMMQPTSLAESQLESPTASTRDEPGTPTSMRSAVGRTPSAAMAAASPGLHSELKRSQSLVFQQFNPMAVAGVFAEPGAGVGQPSALSPVKSARSSFVPLRRQMVQVSARYVSANSADRGESHNLAAAETGVSLTSSVAASAAAASPSASNLSSLASPRAAERDEMAGTGNLNATASTPRADAGTSVVASASAVTGSAGDGATRTPLPSERLKLKFRTASVRPEYTSTASSVAAPAATTPP